MRIGKIISIFFLFISLFGEVLATDHDHDRILRAFQECIEWDIEDIVISSIDGGLTNTNYKVTVNGTPYFFRLSSQQNALLNISLYNEYEASKAASDAAIGPKIIAYCPQEAILVTEFITPVNTKVDAKDLEMQRRFCESIRALHALKITLSEKFCPYETIELYRKNALQIGVVLPEAVEETILPLIEKIRLTIEENSIWVPCHNDLHAGNLLDDGEKIWLIDWEYAAMGDPLFDVAAIASVEGFTDEETEHLLKTYLRRDSVTKEELRSFLFKCALVDIRFGFWCFLQASISSLEYDFVKDGKSYFKNGLEKLRAITENDSKNKIVLAISH